MANSKTKQKERMVEEMGVFFENQGLAPMHGRVFAYLLLSEPPHKDFYDIQEFLKASKSAISNALRFLLDRNLIKYITFSGDRRRYFQINMEGWMAANTERILQTNTMNRLLEDVLEARSEDKFVEFNEQLKTMKKFHTSLAEVLNTFIEKWNKEND